MHWMDERFERWWEDMEKTGDSHEMEQLRERLNGWLEKMDIQVQFRIDVWQDAQQEMGRQRCPDGLPGRLPGRSPADGRHPSAGGTPR